ncbi:MAG: ribosomal protein S18-alanine N-acetyltransferase [Moorea sp. SIO2B7]|nr:ribosomal protein S18-alanine N-acetyltransferase [Moorena sp. SIO2B7]
MTLAQLNLKPPKAEQLTQVVELDNLCLGGIWTLEGYKRELESPNSSLFVLSMPILLADKMSDTEAKTEKIIGFGCFWAILEEAHLTILAIHPDNQGQGLGQLLLCTLFREAVERNLERATLEVRESNQVALSLYQKFGFKIAGRRKGYYQKTGEDALILWRGDLNKPEFEQNLATWQEKVHKKLAKTWEVRIGERGI